MTADIDPSETGENNQLEGIDAERQVVPMKVALNVSHEPNHRCCRLKYYIKLKEINNNLAHKIINDYNKSSRSKPILAY